jgi:hypothetical protein
MMRALWDLHRIPSKMTYWQKLRFVYMLALLLTPREQTVVVPRYLPYVEDEPTFLGEDDEYTPEPLAYTALRVADLVAGVKGLKTS